MPLSPKDRNAIKGAVRRAFARSDVHKEVMERNRVQHVDPERPRCRNWSRCEECKEITPSWKCVVDHRDPIIPVTKRTDEMSIEEIVIRIFCDISNLQVLCEDCHTAKTKRENALRPKRLRKKKNA